MLSNLGGALASMRQANERLEASKVMLNQHVLLALIKNILGIYDCLDPAQCKRFHYSLLKKVIASQLQLLKVLLLFSDTSGPQSALDAAITGLFLP